MTVKRPRFFYGYWMLLAGFLFQVITHGCTAYAFSLFVLPLDNEFGWSRAIIMTGSLILSVIMGIASPFVGRMIDKWNAKWIITTGAIVMGAGFWLLGLMNSLWQFYLFYAIVGLGSAATGVVPATMVLANWFKKRRGFAIGILGMGIGVGGFTVPRLLSNYIIPSFGWRAAYYTCGILSVTVIIPLALRVIKSVPEDMGFLPDNGVVNEKSNQPASLAPELAVVFNQALKTPAFWFMAIAFTTFSLANGNIFMNQVPHLQNIGFPAIEAAIALQAIGLGSAIGKFGFGWLCDYIRSKYILVIGSAFLISATLVLSSITRSSPVFLLWICGLLAGLGIGSWLPAISITTSSTFGLISYGVIFGIYNMLFSAGAAIGPVIGGYIFDITGSYESAFWLGLIFFAFAIPFMLLVRRPQIHGG